MIYIGILYVREYNIEEMNKVIIKSLHPKAMVKYVGEGGDNLEDKQDILELMTQIDKKFKLKAKASALKRKTNQKEQHSNHSKEKSSNNSSKKGGKNPCRKHDDEHEWKDCPDYKPPNKVKEKFKKGDGKAIKKDLHSTTNKAIIVKMPTV